MAKLLFLSTQEVIKIHIVQIESFGGTHGIRDLGLLESAVATPRMQFKGKFLYQSIEEMAAAYMYHIIKNHAFVDGNKRAGMATGLIFLHSNHYTLPWTQQEVFSIGCAIAQSSLTEKELTKLLRDSWS